MGEYIHADVIEKAKFVVSTAFITGYEENCFLFVTDKWAIAINTQREQFLTV